MGEVADPSNFAGPLAKAFPGASKIAEAGLKTAGRGVQLGARAAGSNLAAGGALASAAVTGDVSGLAGAFLMRAVKPTLEKVGSGLENLGKEVAGTRKVPMDRGMLKSAIAETTKATAEAATPAMVIGLAQDTPEEAGAVAAGILGAGGITGAATGTASGAGRTGLNASINAFAGRLKDMKTMAADLGAKVQYGDGFDEIHATNATKLSPSDQTDLNRYRAALSGLKTKSGKPFKVIALDNAGMVQLSGTEQAQGQRAMIFNDADGNYDGIAINVDALNIPAEQALGHETGHLIGQVISNEIDPLLASSLRSALATELYDKSGNPIPEFQRIISQYAEETGLKNYVFEGEPLADLASALMRGANLEQYGFPRDLRMRIYRGMANFFGGVMGLSGKLGPDGTVEDAGVSAYLDPDGKGIDTAKLKKTAKALHELIGVFGRSDKSQPVGGDLRGRSINIPTPEAEFAPKPPPPGEPPAPSASPASTPSGPTSSPTVVRRLNEAPDDEAYDAKLAELGLDPTLVESAREKWTKRAEIEEQNKIKRGVNKGKINKAKAKKAIAAREADFDDLIDRAGVLIEAGEVDAPQDAQDLEVLLQNVFVHHPESSILSKIQNPKDDAEMELRKRGDMLAVANNAVADFAEGKINEEQARGMMKMAGVPEKNINEWIEARKVTPSETPSGEVPVASPQQPAGPVETPADLPRRIEEALTAATANAEPKQKKARSDKRRAEIAREERVNALKGLLDRRPGKLQPITDPDTGEVSFQGDFDESDPVHAAIAKELGYTPQDIKNVTDAQGAKGKGVYLRDYLSAEQEGFEEGGVDFTAEQRKEEYGASPAQQRADTGARISKQDKGFTPIQTVLTKEGVVIRGFDHDKFLNNISAIESAAAQAGIQTGLEGMDQPAKDRAIADAFQGVVQNHLHGWKGDGSAPLIVDPASDITPEQNYNPVKVSPQLATVINMAMHNRSARPPKKPRGDSEAAQKRYARSMARSKEAIGLNRLNDGFLDDTTAETNAMRAQLEAGGFETDRILKPTISNVRPDLIAGGIGDTPSTGKSVHAHGFDVPPSVMSKFPKGNITAAGFMAKGGDAAKPQKYDPAKDERKTIEANAPSYVQRYSDLADRAAEGDLPEAEAKEFSDLHKRIIKDFGSYNNFIKEEEAGFPNKTAFMSADTEAVAKVLNRATLPDERIIKSSTLTPEQSEAAADKLWKIHQALQSNLAAESPLASLGANKGQREGEKELGSVMGKSAESLGFKIRARHPSNDFHARFILEKPKGLTTIGAGAESIVYRQPDGSVLKVFTADTDGTVGLVDKISDGVSRPFKAVRDNGSVEEIVEKLAVLAKIGGIPSEILAITPENHIIVAQPYSPREGGHFMFDRDGADKSLIRYVPYDEDGNLDLNDERVTIVDGRPYLLSDIHPQNVRRDNQDEPRVTDMMATLLPKAVYDKLPALRRVISELREAEQKLTAPRSRVAFMANETSNRTTKRQTSRVRGTRKGGESGSVTDRADAGGRAPEAARRSVRAEPFVHYGNLAGLEVLDPAKFGTGKLGAERARARDYKDIWQNRVYLGLRGYKKEPGLPNNEYKGTVDRALLYDFVKDPLDLYEQAQADIAKSGRYARFDDGAILTQYENLIKRHGFIGYKADDAAAIFHPIPTGKDVTHEVFSQQAPGYARRNPEIVRLVADMTENFNRIEDSYFEQKPADREQVRKQAKIAKAYDKLKADNLDNKNVRQAYDSLTEKVTEQYKALEDAGITIEAWAEKKGGKWQSRQGQPYKNSGELQADLRNNKHLYFFITEPETFGSTSFSDRHPMLKQSGMVDPNGYPVMNNDALRAVHDAIAHGAFGVQFGPAGEEAAWRAHMATIEDPWARWALTTETRGQNSWVNFRPEMLDKKGQPLKQGDKGYVAPQDRPFAQQKADLMDPKWLVTGNKEVDSALKNPGFRKASGFKGGFMAGESLTGSKMYSQLERVAGQKIKGRMSPDQLRATLQNNGVKQAEIDWVLGDLLERKKGQQITPQELADEIVANQVQLREIVKDDSREPLSYGESKERDELIAKPNLTEQEQRRLQQLNHIKLASEGNYHPYSPTKFGQYQLPGGENYRELLYQLPDKSKEKAQAASEKFISEMRKKYGDDEGMYDRLSPEEKRESERLLQARHSSPAKFKSSHFDDPNILFHLRVNDRKTTKGESMLFSEEEQSDWHQKGRDIGYQTPLDPNDLTATQRASGRWDVRDKTGHLIKQTEAASEAEAIEKVAKGGNPEGVPDAPFKGEGWKLLGLKKLIEIAVREGKDRIGWTTGEQQAERYNLSHRLDRIEYQKENDKYLVRAFEKDDPEAIMQIDGLPKSFKDAAEIEKFFGKDVARQIVEDTAPDNPHKKDNRFSLNKAIFGDNLKVGGEGMKGFYDKELVNLANDLGKKYGAKVEKVNVKTHEQPQYSIHKVERGRDKDKYRVLYKGEWLKTPTGRMWWTSWEEAEIFAQDNIKMEKTEPEVWSLPITPKLREAVSAKGQPLFMAAEGESLTGSEIERLTKELADLEAEMAKMDQPDVAANRTEQDLRIRDNLSEAYRKVRSELRSAYERQAKEKEYALDDKIDQFYKDPTAVKVNQRSSDYATDREAQKQFGDNFYSLLENVVREAFPAELEEKPGRTVKGRVQPGREIRDKQGNLIKTLPERREPDKVYPAESIWDQVEPILKKYKVKPEEIEWTDIEAFIKSKKKLTANEVLEYVQDQNVEVEQVDFNGENTDRWVFYDGGSIEYFDSEDEANEAMMEAVDRAIQEIVKVEQDDETVYIVKYDEYATDDEGNPTDEVIEEDVEDERFYAGDEREAERHMEDEQADHPERKYRIKEDTIERFYVSVDGNMIGDYHDSHRDAVNSRDYEKAEERARESAYDGLSVYQEDEDGGGYYYSYNRQFPGGDEYTETVFKAEPKAIIYDREYSRYGFELEGEEFPYRANYVLENGSFYLYPEGEGKERIKLDHTKSEALAGLVERLMDTAEYKATSRIEGGISDTYSMHQYFDPLGAKPLKPGLKKDVLRPSAYKGGHWYHGPSGRNPEQENVFLHVRHQEFQTDAKDDALHIEEVQSDPHQDAREARKDAIKREMRNGATREFAEQLHPLENFYAIPKWQGVVDGGRVVEFKSKKEAEAEGAVDIRPVKSTGVTPLPFKKGYLELAFKKMLGKAVSDGKDVLTWTTGATQAERNDLAKVVDRLIWSDGILSGYQGSTKVFSQSVAEDSLSDYVGSNVADRLIEERRKHSEVSGADKIARLTKQILDEKAGSKINFHTYPSISTWGDGWAVRGHGDVLLSPRLDSREEAEKFASEIKGMERTFEVRGRSGGSSFVISYGATREEAAKIAAENIVDGRSKVDITEETGWLYPSVEGDNLDVGKQGMKFNYDYRAVKYMEELLKPAGAKVEEMTLRTGDGPQKVWGVRITPEVEAFVKRGLPVFMAKQKGKPGKATKKSEPVSSGESLRDFRFTLPQRPTNEEDETREKDRPKARALESLRM